MRKQSRTRGFLTVAILFVTQSVTFASYGITMGSPYASSTWQAGANMFVSGAAMWQPAPPINDPAPTGVAIYIHAGGNGGPVTNSGWAPIGQGNGNAAWNTTLQLIAHVPPLSSGPGKTAPYHVEAVLFGVGVPIVQNNNVVRVNTGITVVNG